MSSSGLWRCVLELQIYDISDCNLRTEINRILKFQLTLEWFQDGEVTTEEFIKAIRTTSMGKPFDGLPACLKTFIGAMFKTIDIDGMMKFLFELIQI